MREHVAGHVAVVLAGVDCNGLACVVALRTLTVNGHKIFDLGRLYALPELLFVLSVGQPIVLGDVQKERALFVFALVGDDTAILRHARADADVRAHIDIAIQVGPGIVGAGRVEEHVVIGTIGSLVAIDGEHASGSEVVLVVHEHAAALATRGVVLDRAIFDHVVVVIVVDAAAVDAGLVVGNRAVLEGRPLLDEADAAAVVRCRVLGDRHVVDVAPVRTALLRNADAAAPVVCVVLGDLCRGIARIDFELRVLDPNACTRTGAVALDRGVTAHVDLGSGPIDLDAAAVGGVTPRDRGPVCHVEDGALAHLDTAAAFDAPAEQGNMIERKRAVVSHLNAAGLATVQVLNRFSHDGAAGADNFGHVLLRADRIVCVGKIPSHAALERQVRAFSQRDSRGLVLVHLVAVAELIAAQIDGDRLAILDIERAVVPQIAIQIDDFTGVAGVHHVCNLGILVIDLLARIAVCIADRAGLVCIRLRRRRDRADKREGDRENGRCETLGLRVLTGPTEHRDPSRYTRAQRRRENCARAGPAYIRYKCS